VRTKDFSWTLSINSTTYKNEITRMPESNPEIISGTKKLKVGSSLFDYWLREWYGVDPATGNAEYRANNFVASNSRINEKGDTLTTSLNNARFRYNGSAIPDFTGGFTNNFRYRGFDLGVFFNFSYGNEVYLGDFGFTENPIGGFNKARVLLNYWTENNRENAFAPARTSATKSTFGQASTRMMLDGSFLRLRNLTLGYTLPASKVNARFFQNARVYVMGQNLLTFRADEELWEGRAQDPEIGYAASNTFQGQSFFTPPQARTITVGFSASF